MSASGRWWLVGDLYTPIWWYVTPVWWWRRWRARRDSTAVFETITLETPSGEGRVVIPAGEDGAWKVYARGELLTQGSCAAILPQCLVDASAPSARERGFVVVADEFHALGMALLEEQVFDGD